MDNNVIRYLSLEFFVGDFDLFILYYLGLDYIGYLVGFNSLLVFLKFREMDEVIDIVYRLFIKVGRI